MYTLVGIGGVHRRLDARNEISASNNVKTGYQANGEPPRLTLF